MDQHEKRAQIIIDADLHRKLKAHAALQGRTVKSIIEEAAREIIGEKRAKK